MLSSNDFLQNYKAYRAYGFDHANARTNTLEDAEPHTDPADRVRISYLVNKLNREVYNALQN